MPEVVTCLQHAHRHRHSTDPKRSKEGGRENRRVVEHEQHPLFTAHAGIAQ
jgi:hypothetical protein